jgi:hypothetical protein
VIGAALEQAGLPGEAKGACGRRGALRRVRRALACA